MEYLKGSAQSDSRGKQAGRIPCPPEAPETLRRSATVAYLGVAVRELYYQLAQWLGRFLA